MANANINDWQAVDDDWEEIPTGADTKFDQRAFDKASPLGGFSNPMQKIMDYLGKSPVGEIKRGYEQGVSFDHAPKEPIEHGIPHAIGYGIGMTQAQSLPLAGLREGQGLRNVFRAGAQGAAQAHGNEQDITKGAGIGAGLQAGLGILGKGIGALTNPQKVQEFANNRAIKSAYGHNLSGLRNAAGITPRGDDVDYIKNNYSKVTKDIFDEGVIKHFDKTQDIGPRLTEAAGKYGKLIGQMGEGLDKAVPDGIVDGNVIANYIKQYADKLFKNESNKNIAGRLYKEAENFKNMARLTFAQAQEAKNSFKYKHADTDAFLGSQDAINATKQAISKGMEDAVAGFEKQNPGIFSKGLLDSYKNAKNKYGSFEPAANIAGERYVRDVSNRAISPSDYLSGGLGATAGTMVGGPLVGAGVAATTGLANNILRKRGGSSAALLGNQWANALQKSPEFLSKFGKILVESMKRGPAAMMSTHYLLMKNPEYQAVMAEEEQE